ncbi:flagellar hook protein FlgE [Marivita sp.]|jgi:flagellar hook protein FlgE|uniref:flagellar hook protein FlgE n=2 Tax=Marivita sp. TaxID=2003365 RepID=UPI00321A29A7
MSISSSLSAGVVGLASHATRLATISDNIANSQTPGYKRVEANFHSMVVTSGGGTYTAGGVRTTTQRYIDQESAITTTSNSTDLAVSGRGFLPVAQATEVLAGSETPQMFLTTTGSFRTDANGYLRTASGQILLGWPANLDGSIPNYPRATSEALEPVRINVNQFSGEPTTRIELGINLPATETEAGSLGDPLTQSIEYYDNLGRAETLEFTFTPVLPATGTSNQWSLEIADSADPGTIIGQYDLEFDDARTLGGTLLNVGDVTGGPYDAATGILTISAPSGPIDINIGRPGLNEGLSQLSDIFAPFNISRDGAPVGKVTSVEVDETGLVNAFYDTGTTRTLYQVPLVDIPNPNGMAAAGSQLYMPTPESGSFFLWDAGNGSTGDILSFALEESATDIANELTELIRTQRAYSSNAKVIQTVDEMLQEATNIKR